MWVVYYRARKFIRYLCACDGWKSLKWVKFYDRKKKHFCVDFYVVQTPFFARNTVLNKMLFIGTSAGKIAYILWYYIITNICAYSIILFFDKLNFKD